MRRLLTLLYLVAALSVWSAVQSADALSPQTTNQGGVAVTVTPKRISDGSVEFEVMLNTHSQDLHDDLTKTAVLIADAKKIAPSRWEGDPPGGHHRKGILRFDLPQKLPATIELQIQRPGESTARLFRWIIEGAKS